LKNNDSQNKAEKNHLYYAKPYTFCSGDNDSRVVSAFVQRPNFSESVMKPVEGEKSVLTFSKNNQEENSEVTGINLLQSDPTCNVIDEMEEKKLLKDSIDLGSPLKKKRCFSKIRPNIESTSTIIMSRPTSNFFLSKKPQPTNYQDYVNTKQFSAKTLNVYNDMKINEKC